MAGTTSLSNTGQTTSTLRRPNVANILLFNFCEQKFIQHGPITIAIDCNGLLFLIFEEKWPNYASGQKSAPNSKTFWVRRLLIFFFPKSASIAVPLPSVVQTYIRSAEG